MQVPVVFVHALLTRTLLPSVFTSHFFFVDEHMRKSHTCTNSY